LPPDVGVHQRDAGQVGGDGEHHRYVFDPVEQRVRRGFPAPGAERATESERRSSGFLTLGEVLLPDVTHQIGQRASCRSIRHDRDAPRLPVATARSEPGVVEYRRDDVVSDRFVGEAAARPGRAQRLDEVHQPRLWANVWRTTFNAEPALNHSTCSG
jgi:hypothetical protein